MITLKNAKKEELNKIAKCHIACFPDYFLTSLGDKLIEKYYEEYINENSPFFVAVNEQDKIIGFCMGYETGSKARNNFEVKYKFHLIYKLIILCLKFDEKAWKRIIAKTKSLLKKSKLSKTNSSTSVKGALLSICVIDDYKGTEVATSLLKEFEDELILRNIKEYTLSTNPDNKRALNFYRKNKMIISINDKNTVYLKKHLN